MDAFITNQNRSKYLFDNFLDLAAKHDSIRNNDINVLFSKKDFTKGFTQTILISKTDSSFKTVLSPKHLAKPDKSDILIFLLFIVALLIQSIVLNVFFKYFKVLLQSLFYDFIAEKAVNESSIPQNSLLRWMELLSILSYFLSFAVIMKFFIGIESGNSLFIFSIGALSIIGYKFWIWLYHKILAFATNAIDFINILHFKNILAINIGGLVLIPISFITSYVNQSYQIYFVYLCISLIGISWLYRYFLSFKLFVKKRVSLLYYILYLCALELPLVFGVIHTLRAN